MAVTDHQPRHLGRVMSKRSAFAAFKPSFLSVGFGWLPELFEEAFKHGAVQLDANLDRTAGNTDVAEGFVGLGTERLLRFGHLPAGAAATAADLSGAAPYRLEVSFDRAEQLTSVKLSLFLLNPRAIVSDELLIPAERTADGRFVARTPGPAPVGLILIADPGVSPAERFDILRDGLPSVTFTPVERTRDFAPDTLLARLDVSIEWKDDFLGRQSADRFGRSIGTPDGGLPPGSAGCVLEHFSPALPDAVRCLVDKTRTVGLELRHEVANGIQIVMKPPRDREALALYRKALVEFNLKEDFKGLLFEGVRGHWLDDQQYGHANFPSLGVSLSAVAFGGGGKGKGESRSKWYVTFEAELPPPDQDGYLNLLTDVRLQFSLAENDIKHFSLRGTFKEFEQDLFAWLSGRTAVLSWRSERWKDAKGVSHDGAMIDLALEATSGDVLRTLTAESPVRMDPKVFSQLAVALTLAPIVLANQPVNAPDGAHPPNDKTRGYFVVIRGKDGLAQLYAGLALGAFFTKFVWVDELRIVGIRLQRQPRAVNDARADLDDYQTALLFDYETDFQINLKDAEITTARPLTARIDGTGFSIDRKKKEVYWVQVPSGIRELSVADPSLWDLGKLGKLLKVVDLSIRRKPEKQLVIRLRLNGNMDIVAAGDFVFVVPIEGNEDPSIEAFPSQITVKTGGVTGTGTLVISKTETGRDITGSLDLQFASGFRLSGAVRVAHVRKPGGAVATATIFGVKVQFASPVPVFGTGLGWTGLDAVVATHFKRKEPVGTAVVPPALAWLEQAKGEVVDSITDKSLWDVEYDRTTIGVGVMLQLMASGDLLNLNGMLVIERPGPRILIFAKANLLEAPKENEEASDDLKRGIIGVLELDQVRDELTLSALADIAFKEFVQIRAPLQLFFDLQRASRWHLYLGHFLDPVTATLRLPGIAEVTATGYFMAAGDVIPKFPITPVSDADLPGVAIAMGAGASITIGRPQLYARGGIDTYLLVSLSQGFYVSGAVRLIGELRLFIVTIGVSSSLRLQYFRATDGTQALFLDGDICGHYKTRFIDIHGCISIRIGAQIAAPLALSPLSNRVSLVAGANVALRGQGRDGPIDAVLSEAVLVGDKDTALAPIPIDAVIAISMVQPPKIHHQPSGFASYAPSFKPSQTRFNLGSAKGEYALKSVTLSRQREAGAWEEIKYKDCPARWWQGGVSANDGVPTPMTLALMTRSPLSAQNVIVSPAQLEAWLDSIIAGICDAIVLPQACWYALTREDCGVTEDGAWELSAVLRDVATEVRIGRSGASASGIALRERDSFGTPQDSIPGYPRFSGSCVVETDPASNAPVAILSIYSRIVASGTGRVRVASRVLLKGEMAPSEPLEVLIAHTPLAQAARLMFRIDTSHGNAIWVQYSDLIRDGLVEDLRDAQVRTDFHEAAANWEPPTEAFAGLSRLTRYARYEFHRVVIDLSTLPLAADEVPTQLEVTLSNDIPADEEIDAILGGYRFVPFAELRRYEEDVRHQRQTIAGLKEYLDGKPIPLLEPNSIYRIGLEWDAQIDGASGVRESRDFEFCTTAHPPDSAAPYLLATFPQANERFHCVTDMPGFALGSTDALRILAKFSDARLKVTITEDGGTSVTGAAGAVRWDQGVLVAPAALDPAVPAPTGFFRASIASLPSALQNAIYERYLDGSLACLGEISLPAGGIFIGFEVDLLALSGYRIAIEVVSADGSPWSWPGRGGGNGEGELDEEAPDTVRPTPFLEWRFSTALHRDLASYAAALGATRLRQRVLLQPLDAVFPAGGATPQQLAEKPFEDALAQALGERPDRSGESRLTLLWRRDVDVLKATALLIESREPLLRTTQSVRVGPLSETAPDTAIAEPADLPLQSIDAGRSLRLAGLTYSSSGCACLARIDENAPGDFKLALARHPVERIPVTRAMDAAVEKAAAQLAPRPLRTG
jgi:hypothetical protein